MKDQILHHAQRLGQTEIKLSVLFVNYLSFFGKTDTLITLVLYSIAGIKVAIRNNSHDLSQQWSVATSRQKILKWSSIVLACLGFIGVIVSMLVNRFLIVEWSLIFVVSSFSVYFQYKRSRRLREILHSLNKKGPLK